LRGNNLERLLQKSALFKVIKSGPYKDILAFDRDNDGTAFYKDLIDTSYQQFVQTVAEALAVDAVKSFADGRIFTGQQAVELGVVDRLGTEEDARRWAAELALIPIKPSATLWKSANPY